MASFDLAGMTGVIIGGAGGIGQTLSKGLASAGADLLIADLPSQRVQAEEVAHDIVAMGRQAATLDLDVTSLVSIETMVSQAIERFGRIDWLVNTAGMNIRKPVLDYTEQDWDRMLAVNLKGAFFMTQAAARVMQPRRRGRIVHIASQLAAVAMHDRSIYAITKAALAHMCKAFAVELAPYGLTFNAVGPTFVSTPLTTSMFSDPVFVDENLPHIPAGRFGTTDDVLGAVHYLVSDAAALVNGHLLLVDGGYTAW
ncbi:MAG: SDR family oxidoreductase [Chloroflexi bacterium]|nr:SDR family oxidoreductase [Chloroflexota bacterium]